MKPISIFKAPFHTALLVTGFTLGPGLSGAVADTVITGQVKARLMTEDALSHFDIDVVTLTGLVSNENVKSLARATTKSVEAVKSVDNALITPGSWRDVGRQSS